MTSIQASPPRLQIKPSSICRCFYLSISYTCPLQGLGMIWSLRSLLTQTILWFCIDPKSLQVICCNPKRPQKVIGWKNYGKSTLRITQLFSFILWCYLRPFWCLTHWSAFPTVSAYKKYVKVCEKVPFLHLSRVESTEFTCRLHSFSFLFFFF